MKEIKIAVIGLGYVGLPLARLFATKYAITIDKEELEFSDGFTELHTISYQKILQHQGFGLEEVRPSIEIVQDIRNSEINNLGHKHPFLK